MFMVAILHMFIPLMWFYALQTEDLQAMLGQHTHTHTPSTNIGTTNQSTPLPRHLWLYGVGARCHLRWWLHDWLARQTLDLAEPCRLAIVTVGRGPKKHKAHWKSSKLYWHPWIWAALAYVFADFYCKFTVLLILSRLSFFYTCDFCWCNNW